MDSIAGVRDSDAARSDRRRLPPALLFALLALLVWIGLYTVYLALPFSRPGADLVTEAKFERLATRKLFSSTDRNRVLVFGTSRILAGFRPDRFDRLLGAGTRSYNLGLPGDDKFLPILRKALESGNRPTHVLLTAGWPDAPRKPGVLDALSDDKATLQTLIPFRNLPRNLVVFTMLGPRTIGARYAESGRIVDQMLAQRGWYFIKSQSRFANDSLPADFTLPTDKPGVALRRTTASNAWMLREVSALARQYGFRVIVVPDYYRAGSYAPPPAQPADRARPINGVTAMLGPDYFLYPAPGFADPVHLNPTAAITYTDDVAALVKASGVIR